MLSRTDPPGRGELPHARENKDSRFDVLLQTCLSSQIRQPCLFRCMSQRKGNKSPCNHLRAPQWSFRESGSISRLERCPGTSTRSPQSDDRDADYTCWRSEACAHIPAPHSFPERLAQAQGPVCALVLLPWKGPGPPRLAEGVTHTPRAHSTAHRKHRILLSCPVVLLWSLLLVPS